MTGRSDFIWRGDALFFGGRGVGRVVADPVWPKMWRVEYPDGSLSDMVNHVRAKDAAESHALSVLRPYEDDRARRRGGQRSKKIFAAV